MDYSYNFPSDGPYSTNIGDINGDNIKDVVFTTFSNKLITLIGNSNGTFTQSVTINIGVSPAFSELKDVNNDNILDCIIANYGTKDLSILIGTGTGSFVNTGTLSCGTVTGTAQIYDLKVVDMNNDNNNDIVVSISNYNPASINILLGNGNGTFGAVNTNTTFGAGTARIGIIDLNNDGNKDVVCTNGLAGASIHYGTGTASLMTYTFIPGVGFGNDIAFGDFNNDGNSDFAFMNSQSNNMCLYFGNGLGSYTTSVISGLVDSPFSVSSGDVTGDSKTDLVVMSEGGIRILTGNGLGSFTVGKIIGLDLNSSQGGGTIKLNDYDNNGTLDIICTTSANDKHIYFLPNPGGGNFKGLPIHKFNSISGSSGFVMSDLNGDGRKDLVIGTNNGIEVSLANGTGGYLNPNTYTVTGGSAISVVLTSDINNDLKQDIVALSYSTNKISVYLGNGTGSFSSSTSFPLSVTQFDGQIGDFNNDGNKDLAVLCSSSNLILFSGDGLGNLTPTNTITTLGNPYSIALADFNTDGNLDIVYAALGGNAAYVFIGNGSFGFASAVSYPSGGNGTIGVETADVNNDGNKDIIVVNQTSNNLGVLLGSPSGTFQTAVSFTTGVGPRTISIADMNNDSKLDVVTGNYNTYGFSVLLGSGSGSFGAASHFQIGRLINQNRALQIDDVNNDGTKDVLVRSNIVVNFNLGRPDVIVSHNNNAFITSSTSNTICNGSPIVLYANQNAFNYLWTPGSSTSNSITVTTGGIYSVTMSNLFSGCNSTATMAVVSNPVPTLNVTGTQTICAGGSTTLTAAGALTYSWNNGPSNPTIAVSPSITTVYSVSGTNSFSCSATTSVSVMVNPCTAISEFKESLLGVKMFPNPNQGEFTIVASEEGDYQLVDQFGRVIKSFTIDQNNNYSYRIEGLTNGIYFVKGNKTSTTKIVVLN